jgi:hypothetical protein
MSVEGPDEEKEKATVLTHIANVVLPEKHLAPWASVHKKRTIVALATLYTVGAIAIEVDRRVWLDKHPDEIYHPDDSPEVRLNALIAWAKQTPAASVSPEKVEAIAAEITGLSKLLAEEDDEDEEEEDKGPLFDQTRVRGANGMFGFCMKTYAQYVHDLAPSEGGLRTKQAIAWGGSMRSGLSIEPKPRSLWEKVTGRGKEKEQIATGTQ